MSASRRQYRLKSYAAEKKSARRKELVADVLLGLLSVLAMLVATLVYAYLAWWRWF